LKKIEEFQAKNLNKIGFSYFSPRRFNRYPRFTIYIKKDEGAGKDSRYEMENTVSLNPRFLQYVMENNVQLNSNNVIEMSEQEFERSREQGFIVWNEKNTEQRFDPFEKVILVKGIDNSILTSFRTLKKENNILSETMKIIHNKFQPMLAGKNQAAFFQQMYKRVAQKMQYPLTDTEDSISYGAFQMQQDSKEVGIGSEIKQQLVA